MTVRYKTVDVDGLEVFYREAGGELCLVDIAWWTVQ